MLTQFTTGVVQHAAAAPQEPLPVAEQYTYRVIGTFPHDHAAFTQGLVLDNGKMYESTGRYGKSSLRRVDVETGKPQQQYRLSRELYGEGITVFGDKIIQLTWKSKLGLVYNKNSFKRIQKFIYPHEGWGITHDGYQLIVSDGTPTIRFLDPDTYTEKRRIQVADQNGPVEKINELEYVEGKIFANVWRSDKIAIIDPEDGRVTGWLDLSRLGDKERKERQVNVLNGIAYDQDKNILYVTGKYWARVYAIQLVHEEKQ